MPKAIAKSIFRPNPNRPKLRSTRTKARPSHRRRKRRGQLARPAKMENPRATISLRGFCALGCAACRVVAGMLAVLGCEGSPQPSRATAAACSGGTWLRLRFTVNQLGSGAGVLSVLAGNCGFAM